MIIILEFKLIFTQWYLPPMYEFKLYPVLDFLLSPLCITAQWFTCLIDLALTSKPWLDLLSGYKRLSNEPSTATESCIGCLWHSENNFHNWYPVRSILQTCDIFGDQAFFMPFPKKNSCSQMLFYMLLCSPFIYVLKPALIRKKKWK